MRRTPIILLIILLIVLIGVGYFITDPDSAQEILIELGLAEPVEEGYTVTGMLEARVTYLASVNGGRVKELPTNVGERVDQGRILASLDTALLEPLLEAAQARHEAALAQLELLKADPRDVDLALAKAAINHADTLYESALKALEDAREFAPEAIRDDQITLAQAMVDQAEAGLEVAEANLEALEEGATENEINSIEALVDAAEADVASQQSRLDDQVVKAPSSGVVLELFMLPGELALPGQPIVALADLDTLELRVYLPEADMSWARIGDQVNLIVDAYPDRTFAGEVIYISDQAEFTPRNVQTPEERIILVYEILIRVSNSDGELKPGLPAEVTFGVES